VSPYRKYGCSVVIAGLAFGAGSFAASAFLVPFWSRMTAVIAILVFIPSLIYMRTIRCPNCGFRIFANYATRNLTSRNCADCGYNLSRENPN